MSSDKTHNGIIEFGGHRCRVKYGRYFNGDIRINIVTMDTEEPIVTATVRTGKIKLKPRHVLIKTCNENTGIIEVLVNAGILKRVEHTGQSEQNDVQLCEIL